MKQKLFKCLINIFKENPTILKKCCGTELWTDKIFFSQGKTCHLRFRIFKKLFETIFVKIMKKCKNTPSPKIAIIYAGDFNQIIFA